MTGEDRARFDFNGAGQTDWSADDREGPLFFKGVLSGLCLTIAAVVVIGGVIALMEWNIT